MTRPLSYMKKSNQSLTAKLDAFSLLADTLRIKGALKTVLLLLVLCGIGTTAARADDEPEPDPYLFYLLFNDYQACEEKVPLREWNGIDDILCQQLPKDEAAFMASSFYLSRTNRPTGFLAMAQNEKEGFHVFFREQEKERNLRIEVAPFVNEQNEVLPYSLYWEDFFFAPGVGIPDSLAEALVPYAGEIQKSIVGHNKVFYVELKSSMNQTPGYYHSTVSVFDGDELVISREVTAKVWNFALPEGHYSEVVMGLYNCNSGYHATRSIFSLNGLEVDASGNVAEADLPRAKEILDGYQECLLEHGVSTYELPRWKMADDPKAAELTMADPRRKVFSVPVNRGHFGNGDFTNAAKETIRQYKSIVYNNPFLKDKAFFYPIDEPKNTEAEIALLNAMSKRMGELWPGYHAVAPFYSNFDETIALFEGKVDIICPNQGHFNPRGAVYEEKQANFLNFKDREGHPDWFRTWRYQGDAKCGGNFFWIYNISQLGVMHRVPFWQQWYMNSDGWLQWNCAYLPVNWTKKTLPASGGIQTGNADGILLYPGALWGQNAETPIASLRLKQMNDGIEDYDYIRLGMEFVDETSLKSAISRFLWKDYANDCKSINKEYEFYAAYTCTYLQRARYEIGQLLDAANTEHNWGEWQVAVLPDRTHNGLEIRTCIDCGAQSSQATQWVEGPVGDVNGDGKVSITDVTALVNMLLNGIETPSDPDVNGDGKVTITDVTAIINILLNNPE